MVLARNLAAFVALACVGFAVGDWATHPNVIGMLGILLLVAVFGVLLAYLFRPSRARLAAPPPPPPPPRRAPSPSAPPAGWEDADRR